MKFCQVGQLEVVFQENPISGLFLWDEMTWRETEITSSIIKAGGWSYREFELQGKITVNVQKKSRGFRRRFELTRGAVIKTAWSHDRVVHSLSRFKHYFNELLK